MLEKWIILGVHDKAMLEEDDVANAHVILYGEPLKPTSSALDRALFHARAVGEKGLVGSLNLRADGALDLALLDFQGKIWVS